MLTTEPENSWLIVTGNRIQHHLDNPFPVAVGRFKPLDVYTQTPGYRRADLTAIELLPFDFTALENIRRQCLQDGFLLKIEPERFHRPDQPALPMAHVREPF
ncbi:MAG TPA: hypothetical protein VK789_31130 [Bryobacteraceae bacterium]|jgi:hypothetical protein|nr:hypothetical protein [Bryobacteraceae bacterium]